MSENIIVKHDNATICGDCGIVIDTVELPEHVGEYEYVARDDNGEFEICYHCQLGYFYCIDCERYVDNTRVAIPQGDGHCICTYCIDDYTQCDACYNHVHVDDIAVSDGYTALCNDCVDDYTQCGDCGYYYLTDELAVIDDLQDLRLCDACYSERYFRCDRCDNVYHVHSRKYYHEREFCGDCYDHCATTSELLHSYSYKPYFRKIKSDVDNNDDLTIGIELEIDNGEFPDEIARGIIDEFGDDVYCKKDGSLSDVGIEIVTLPMTYNYIVRRRVVERICNVADCNDYKSHDTTTCGLHIHLDRNFCGNSERQRRESIIKALYFMHKHWDDVVKYSRRKRDRIENWANRLYLSDLDDVNDAGTDFGDADAVESYYDMIGKFYYNARYTRYQCINICNPATIEFRIFRGTLNSETIHDNIQFCIKLIQFCKTATFDDIRNADISQFTVNNDNKEDK